MIVEKSSSHGMVGSLSDRLGRRWFFIVGNVFALVGAIICAAAQSVNVVIVGMTFAGIGAANQQLAMTGVSELFRNKHRSYAQGKWRVGPKVVACKRNACLLTPSMRDC
jgi:MFS family permease